MAEGCENTVAECGALARDIVSWMESIPTWVWTSAAYSLWIGCGLFGCLGLLAALIVYKLLRVPRERDPSKLYLDVFPVERWRQNKGKRQGISRKVALLTYGTRGDVQPLVALAQELRKHQVEAVICTSDSFEQFITANGCAFVSCGVTAVEQPAFLFDPERATSFAQVMQVVADVYPRLSEGMWKASQKFEPDLIISQAVVRGIGAQISERMGIPHWVVHFAPSNTATVEFPPAEYPQSRFGFINKLKYAHRNIEIAKAAMRTGLSKSDVLFRKSLLGLPAPLDPLVLVSDMEREVSIHAYSPILQPKPKDWPFWHLVVGAFTLEKTQQAQNLRLESSLESFLRKDEWNKPVYIGFGSMEGAEKQFAMTVRCVLKELKLRAVICAEISLENLQSEVLGEVIPNDQFILIKSAPHELLFPRCALVIHHGGAGTTNAAIAAGVPQVVNPILAWSDQPFWANVVERMGIGFRVDDVRGSSSGLSSSDGDSSLQQRITQCLECEIIQERALALKCAKHPNGAVRVADLVTHLFEL